MEQEIINEVLEDLSKQGDVHIYTAEAHHEGYERKSKTGKQEHIPQKGAKLKKPEEHKKEAKGKQEAGQVLGGEEHQQFKGLLEGYFNAHKEIKDLSDRVNNLKNVSEDYMKQIRPLLTKFDNLETEAEKFKTQFTEGSWDYKFLSFTRETKSYKELYSKAFNMLNQMQKDEMQKAEKALQTITAQEKFERTEAEKSDRFMNLVKSYVGKPDTEETLKFFRKDLMWLMLIEKAVGEGAFAADRKTKQKEEDDEEETKKRKKKIKPGKKVDKEEDKDEVKNGKDKKEKPKADKDDKGKGKSILLEDTKGDKKSDKGVQDKDGSDKDNGEKEDKGEKGGKITKAHKQLVEALTNLIALKQRGNKMLKHFFGADKKANGEKRSKNEEDAKKDRDEKSKSLIEDAMPIVAMKVNDVLEKARSHKYIRRLGAPKDYRYVYQMADEPKVENYPLKTKDGKHIRMAIDVDLRTDHIIKPTYQMAGRKKPQPGEYGSPEWKAKRQDKVDVVNAAIKEGRAYLDTAFGKYKVTGYNDETGWAHTHPADKQPDGANKRSFMTTLEDIKIAPA